MHFPFWQYLNQLIWDNSRPFIFNPVDYWRHHRRRYLNRCLSNAFLEQCWQVRYRDFALQHLVFCCRIPLEENPRWLIKRCCWHLQKRDRNLSLRAVAVRVFVRQTSRN